MQSLLTPWRYDYLTGPKPDCACIFCQARDGSDDDETLIVHRAKHSFVILNRYPYSNGHVMVVPNDHVARPSQSDPAHRAELFDIASVCEAVLREQYNADGINLGMNIGRAAGAGVVSHYHLHIVPRWDGDTNFMAVTAGTRLIPEELADTCRRLRSALSSRLGPKERGDNA